MEDRIKHLVELYQNTSKHSNYQILPGILAGIIPAGEIEVKSRFENERLDYLERKLQFADKKVMDIGGNTGFFTFEALQQGANKVVYIEGNKQHADFVEATARLFEKNVDVKNQYLNFSGELPGAPFDIVLLFNVLHHFGDDYGDSNASIENAKLKIIESINYFQDKTEYLVLQIGFCWKGDRNHLLFTNGTKKEMIDFVSAGIKDKWDLVAIGVAESKQEGISYHDLSDQNIERSDKLGEFLNRPVFILKSK